MMETFLDRLKTIVAAFANGKHTVFAESVDIPIGSFQYYWTKGAVPKAEHLLRIAEKYSVDLHWLLTGNGTITRGAQPIDDTTTSQAVASLREILASDDPVWKPAILANLAAFRQAVDQKREMEKLRQEVAAVKAMDRPRCPNPTAGAIDLGSTDLGATAKDGSNTAT